MIFRLILLGLGITTVSGALFFEGATTSPESAPQATIAVIPTIPFSGGNIVTEEVEVSAPAVPTISAPVSTTPVAKTISAPTTPKEQRLREYIKVVSGCGPYWSGECLNARSGPGTDYRSIAQLRTGIVLATKGSIEVDGKRWYKIAFDEWLRYPERLKDDWYVSAEFVSPFKDPGIIEMDDATPSTTKRIVVDRSEQKLYAYEGTELFMEETISTGLDLTPTPRGTFTIFKKTPSRYMQGPLPGISHDYYDLPGVPWNLYFTEAGGAIHGAYWHDKFGQKWSHGCVNLPLDMAEKLYNWAPVGTTVTVQD